MLTSKKGDYAVLNQAQFNNINLIDSSTSMVGYPSHTVENLTFSTRNNFIDSRSNYLADSPHLQNNVEIDGNCEIMDCNSFVHLAYVVTIMVCLGITYLIWGFWLFCQMIVS